MAKYVFDSVDYERKLICMVSKDDLNQRIEIEYNIKLNWVLNNSSVIVRTNFPTADYDCIRLINPYFNAQNDVLELKMATSNGSRSVGYIFPLSSLQDDEELQDEDFSEIRQAYKFYAILTWLEQMEWTQEMLASPLKVSTLLNKDCAFCIVYKPLIGNSFSLLNSLPSLASHGYYHFPTTSKGGVINILKHHNNANKILEVLSKRFQRESFRIKIHDCNSILSKNPMIRLLYKDLLVDADNCLYRFLLLYQIIETIAENMFHIKVNNIIVQKRELSNYRFVQAINKAYDIRATINTAFNDIQFEGKDEILTIISGFIKEIDASYNKMGLGDCLYDMRNLLFHDYKSVLANNVSLDLDALIIQYEILIHHLIISLGQKDDEIEVPLLNLLFRKECGIS